MSGVHQLYRLQQIDTEVQQKKQRLREVLQAQKDDAALQAARAREATTSGRLRDSRDRQKELELELSGVNDKAKRSESRLYSGNVRNPKELADLEHEIGALGRRRIALEDEILEAMLGVEEAQAEYEQAAGALQKIEGEWQRRRQSLQEEQTQLARRVNELLAQREQMVPRIPADLLRVYQAAGRQGNDLAVAVLQHNTCQACGVSVSANKAKAVSEGQLVYCGSCGRILSMPVS